MARVITREQRITGCLVGAAIGAELGFARCVEDARYDALYAKRTLDVTVSPAKGYQADPHRTDVGNARALVDAGVRAYLRAKGRATPEDFAAVYRDHPGVAGGGVRWDGLHTIQEILKEGMNPRLSGFGAYPNGFICAAMPAVGAYHFAYPEYAYLDGVELASVAQGRDGADWAGLCAAAIAAAFEPGADAESVIDAVLRSAFHNNKDLHYDLTAALGNARCADEKEFLDYWFTRGGQPDFRKDTLWVAYDPLYFVLPLLRHLGGDARKLMTCSVVAPSFVYSTGVHPIISGAILGAMRGPDVFPREWRAWAEAIAKPWLALAGVIDARVKDEAKVISVTEKLAEAPGGAEGASLLQEKTRGCILAGAIGNAMGSPVEGRYWHEVDKKHPGGITTVLDTSRLENEDDNQAAMMIVETYLEREGLPVMARHLGKTWVETMNRDKFYPYCMGHTYDLLRKGWDARIIGQWAVVTGSTVMCMEPVGVYHMGDPEFAAIDATAVSYMYQRGLDVTCAVMLAATVAEAFRPNATVDSVLKAALKAAPTKKLRTFDARRFKSCRDYLEACLDVADKYTDVMAARKELSEKCLMYHHMDPLELWGLALAMFKIARGDVRQAAIGGTNIGRDADTISGRAAMLAGTVSGVSNVPKDWIALFKPATLGRIYGNADRFADFIVSRKLPNLRHRQQA